MHKAQSSVLVLDKLGVAVHACNPGALKIETGGSEAEVRFRHRVSSSLGFVKHCFKRQNKQTCTCAHSGTLCVSHSCALVITADVHFFPRPPHTLHPLAITIYTDVLRSRQPVSYLSTVFTDFSFSRHLNHTIQYLVICFCSRA